MPGSPRLRELTGQHTLRLSSLFAALILVAVAASAGTAPLPLRGFGAVTVGERARAEGKESWITFAAEDAAHARVIGSKFVADLLGFGDLKEKIGTGLPGTVIALEGAGAWLIGLEGANCQVLFARSEQALAAFASREKVAGWQPVPAHAYPRWLDCFDNAATGVWWGRTGGGAGVQDYPVDLEWARDRQFTLTHHGPENNRYVLPGLVDFSPSDWFAAVMKKYDRPYRVYLWPGVTSAGWNHDPLPWQTPGTLKVAYPTMNGQQAVVAGQFVPAGGSETPGITDRYLGDYRRRFAEHLNDDPNYLGGTMVVSENNGANVLHLATATGMPEFQARWRDYLKTTLGWDLRQVGSRHKGRADYYRNWEDVKIPEPQDFLGFDARCLDLVGRWEGRADLEKAGAAAGWYTVAGAPQDGWRPIQCNDPMLLIYDGARNRMRTGREDTPDYWLRRTVTLTAAQVATLKYLHISRNILYASTPTTPLFDVYVNGTELKKLGVDRFESNFSQCLEVGDALHAGDNLVVINTLGCPVPGYLFLGPTPLRLYPGMTEPENRLWYDAVMFDTALRVRAYERTMSAFRSVDANRPFKLATTIDYLDEIIPLCEKYGAYPHNTGGAGGYWCPMYGARLGSAHGVPFSCEQGGPPATAQNLQGAMTYYLMYGNHAVDLVFSVWAYRTKPEVAAWVDRNLALMHCIGKLDLPLPPIGVLRSCRADRLGFAEPWYWDLGRGALQGVGRSFVYVEVPDLSNGMGDRFPVLIDDGTVLLTPEDVAALERYVRAGGTFVALHNTGMHTPERAFSWPISRLTGLRVVNGTVAAGTLKFRDDQTLWPTLRGAEEKGYGMLIDYLQQENVGGAIGLEPEDKGIEVVAEWKDIPAGKGRIAVARRPLGKGQVILLGSTFWRDARDSFGRYRDSDRAQSILDELLTSLRVPRDSRTGNSDVWAERWASKNGVYDLYPVAYMTQKGEEKATVSVTLRREGQLTEVVELSADGHPRYPVRWQEGSFTLPESSYGLMQYRLYGAPRADLENAALSWFDVQRRLWRGLPPIPASAQPQRVEQPENVLPLVEGWTLTTGEPAGDWMQPGATAPGGKLVKLGSFVALDLPEEETARFYKEIVLPAAWRDQRVQLVFDSQWPMGIHQKGHLWINGKDAVTQPKGTDNYTIDVTEQAAAGKLTLALEVAGALPDPTKPREVPSGVTGLFYLQAWPQPVQSTPLAGPWYAANENNLLTAVEPAKPGKYVYLETRFTLPPEWPARRLFLESPGAHLGWIVLNDQVVQTPPAMRSLDISRLVRRDGENTLRWAPFAPDHSRLNNKPIPVAVLSWLP